MHVAVGDTVARAVFITRELRRPALTSIAPHSRAARAFLAALGEWYERKSQDRSAYKRLARSQHGRAEQASNDEAPQPTRET